MVNIVKFYWKIALHSFFYLKTKVCLLKALALAASAEHEPYDIEGYYFFEICSKPKIKRVINT